MIDQKLIVKQINNTVAERSVAKDCAFRFRNSDTRLEQRVLKSYFFGLYEKWKWVPYRLPEDTRIKVYSGFLKCDRDEYKTFKKGTIVDSKMIDRLKGYMCRRREYDLIETALGIIIECTDGQRTLSETDDYVEINYWNYTYITKYRPYKHIY